MNNNKCKTIYYCNLNQIRNYNLHKNKLINMIIIRTLFFQKNYELYQKYCNKLLLNITIFLFEFKE